MAEMSKIKPCCMCVTQDQCRNRGECIQKDAWKREEFVSTQEKAKPTPGPWRIEQPCGGYSDIRGLEGELIFSIASPGDLPEEVCEANACVIEAAWEMLDALKAVKSLFVSPSPFYIQKLDAPITNGDQERIDRVFIAIDAAIAKAEADTGAAK